MSKKTLELDFQNHVKLAKIAGLKYVTDTMPGIRRIKKGNGWQYVYDDGSLCKDEETLLRIKRLVLRLHGKRCGFVLLTTGIFRLQE